MGDNHRIEVVRGALTGERADQLVAFWAAHGALTGPQARQRLPEVVCLLLDATDGILGVNSVYADDVPLIAGRRFWNYRRFFAPGTSEEADAAMLVAAFDALEVERAGDHEAPVGLCLMLDGADTMRRHPEAVWPASQMLYAGYTPDGRQVRIRYFEGARIV